MGASRLIKNRQAGSCRVYSEPEHFDGYEQRLIRWRCAECEFFEKRVFSSRVTSEELDAYIICRFAGEQIDLIWEAFACPRDCRRQEDKNKREYGRTRLHCVPRNFV